MDTIYIPQTTIAAIGHRDQEVADLHRNLIEWTGHENYPAPTHYRNGLEVLQTPRGIFQDRHHAIITGVKSFGAFEHDPLKLAMNLSYFELPIIVFSGILSLPELKLSRTSFPHGLRFVNKADGPAALRRALLELQIITQ